MSEITIFDKEISSLEQRRKLLEAEKHQLLSGLVTISGADSSNIISLNLGETLTQVSEGGEGVEPGELARKMREALAENPLVGELATSFKRKQELQEELAPGSLTKKHSKLGELVLANKRLNLRIKRKSKLAATVAASGWLLVAGIGFLLIWGGLPLLYRLTGGGLGGSNIPNQHPATVQPGATLTAKAKATFATSGSKPSIQPSLKAKAEEGISTDNTAITGSSRVRVSEDNSASTSDSNNSKLVVFNKPALRGNILPGITDAGQVSPPATPTAASQLNLTPTPGSGSGSNESDSEKGNGKGNGKENGAKSSGEAVGQPPSEAGGLNGPHGAFFAPSRMTIAPLELDTLVQRAITQEAAAESVYSSSSSASGSSSSNPAAAGAGGEGQLVRITWPRPGEVVHFGAFPGEVGNMVILGTQKDLNALRRMQQNDEIRVIDRKGNLFIYRVLPFSPSGQTERVIEPGPDNWVFAPSGGQATLTIVVSMPRLLPPYKPGSLGAGAGDSFSPPFSPPTDDYTSPKKLAYRAILAVYAPKELTPPGTPVAVPEVVWKTRPVATVTTTVVPTEWPLLPTPTPAALTSPAATPTPAALTTPSPTPKVVVLPGLPHAGDGGGSNTPAGESQKEPSPDANSSDANSVVNIDDVITSPAKSSGPGSNSSKEDRIAYEKVP